MPVDTITQSVPTTLRAAVGGTTRPALPQSRAARELGLKRSEFDLAVRLGRIRTVPDEGGGGRRVTRAEIDRVASEDGFPEALREQVRAVGTAEGAALLGVTTPRFTRLARLGLVSPVGFYLNRYRTVVWLYAAEDLRRFTEDEKHAPLLRGRTPEPLRRRLDAGLDLRARNWRGRHLGSLLRQANDPWARAAALASLLEAAQVEETVPDPCERAHMNRFAPEPPSRSAAPDSPAALLTRRIMTAEDADEVAWLRSGLASAVVEARADRPAPRPAARPGPEQGPGPECRPASPDPEPEPNPDPAPVADADPDHRSDRASGRHRGLLGWLRRGDD
ncbi:DUF6397 family protein [Streptomyces fructofermentans]|uniref:DUF6397 family protein n=1 Tax=Streptomyces fructofermentans TaxID=152141 RepID=UPI0033C8C6D2